VRENLVYDRVIGPLADFCANAWRRKRTGDSDFLMIPSPKNKGFGYIDQLYIHYRRLPFNEFVRAVFKAAAVLAKNRWDNFRS